MSNKTTISKYLIQALQDAGIEHIFGIPGDYAIKFFSELEKSDLITVGTSSEQGAAFAADAYARINGLGALCVTYSVGGLNTVNAVAGAYAEKAPLIVISGAPGVSERNVNYLLHHSIKDIKSQLNVFKEVTVAQCVLDDPESAPYEINRVIKACLKHKRPVYIEFPRDMIHEECLVPPQKAEKLVQRNDELFNEALKEAVEMIREAKRPVILGGVEIRRYHIEKEFHTLLENTGYPYVTNILGKSIIDESHPQFLGIFMGKMSEPEIIEAIEESDCTIILGALMTDTDTGTIQFNLPRTIYASSDEFCIKHHFYKDIDMKEFIIALSEELKKDNGIKENLCSENPITHHERDEYIVQKDTPMKIKRFFERINNFILDGTPVICDVGDCLFGSSTIKVPKNSFYLGPAFYTSMGYAIPATVGVLMKTPDLRPIVIVGDGAFQMTGYEVSCFVRYGLKPIVFVLNNKGYTTQRYLVDGSYNEIQNWNYHKFPEIVGGGLGMEVSNEEEFEDALKTARENTESFTIINIHLDKYDKSDILYRLTSMMGKKIN